MENTEINYKVIREIQVYMRIVFLINCVKIVFEALNHSNTEGYIYFIIYIVIAWILILSLYFNKGITTIFYLIVLLVGSLIFTSLCLFVCSYKLVKVPDENV